MPGKSLSLIALVLALTALVGCASPPSGQPPVAETPAPQASVPSAEEVASIEAMEPDAKLAGIAESFPVEVPVPAGEVVRGEAQGSDAWDYVVIVEAPPAALLEWYRQAYGSRSWAVVGEKAVETQAGAGTEMTLRKGDAESRVTVVAEGGGSRAAVILGVGAPVLQTQ